MKKMVLAAFAALAVAAGALAPAANADVLFKPDNGTTQGGAN